MNKEQIRNDLRIHESLIFAEFLLENLISIIIFRAQIHSYSLPNVTFCLENRLTKYLYGAVL